ncbi:MAG TPA: hypothetical protein VGN04_14105 [Herbaspirillum sp.]|jgi:hypothetical protein
MNDPKSISAASTQPIISSDFNNNDVAETVAYKGRTLTKVRAQLTSLVKTFVRMAYRAICMQWQHRKNMVADMTKPVRIFENDIYRSQPKAPSAAAAAVETKAEPAQTAAPASVATQVAPTTPAQENKQAEPASPAAAKGTPVQVIETEVSVQENAAEVSAQENAHVSAEPEGFLKSRVRWEVKDIEPTFEAEQQLPAAAPEEPKAKAPAEPAVAPKESVEPYAKTELASSEYRKFQKQVSTAFFELGITHDARFLEQMELTRDALSLVYLKQPAGDSFQKLEETHEKYAVDYKQAFAEQYTSARQNGHAMQSALRFAAPAAATQVFIDYKTSADTALNSYADAMDKFELKITDTKSLLSGNAWTSVAYELKAAPSAAPVPAPAG